MVKLPRRGEGLRFLNGEGDAGKGSFVDSISGLDGKLRRSERRLWDLATAEVVI